MLLCKAHSLTNDFPPTAEADAKRWGSGGNDRCSAHAIFLVRTRTYVVLLVPWFNMTVGK